MQLLFNVDQKAALARGIDAPTSTVRLNVDPAELTPGARELLATVLKDGHDCTGTVFVGDDGKWSTGVNGGHYISATITLVTPTLAGLHDALCAVAEKRTEFLARRATERHDERVRANTKIAEVLKKPLAFETVHLHLDSTGTVKIGWHVDSVTADLPKLANFVWTHELALADPAAVEAYTAAEEAVRRDRAAIMDAHRAALEKLAAERAARIIAEREEYAALIARLPTALRERQADGLATRDEVAEAVASLVRADAGFTLAHVTRDEYRKIDAITDEEHRELKRVKAHVASRALDGVSYAYFRAYDYDLRDGSEINVATIVEVSWPRAGQQWFANIPISFAPSFG